LRAGDDFYVVNDENTIGDETRVATTYTKKLLEIGDKIGTDHRIVPRLILLLN
jgi:pyruvate kinase